MALTINGNRIGRAAHMERIEMRDNLDWQNYQSKKKLLAMTENVVQEVRDRMDTQAEYDAWWASTPDDNNGFFNAACEKLLELYYTEQADYCQTIISGGEVLEVSTVSNPNQNIPF